MEPKTPAADATDPLTAERQRTATILRLTRTARLEHTFADHLISRGISIPDAREAVLNELARRDELSPTTNHHRMENGENREGETRVRLMAEALCARFGGPAPSEEARQYIRLSPVDMARSCLEARGVPTRSLSKSQIIARAGGYHSTSDFPALLTESGTRLLRKSYDAYQGGLRRICRESSAPDFRAKSRLMLSEAPMLEKVNEGGEFKHGSMAESKESYSVKTYGKIFGITRQALVNDDLGAFAEMASKAGRGAAEFIAKQLVALLEEDGVGVGPTMSDGNPLFDAEHGNIGVAAALTLTSLAADIALMRSQKGLDGTTPIDASPKFLVVPVGLELIARQLVASFAATKFSDVNPFAKDIEVVADPRLGNATRRYLAADPNVFDTLEYSFLDESGPGPQIETRDGWEVDGTEWKVRMDFGAGAIDWRGLVTNAGTP